MINLLLIIIAIALTGIWVLFVFLWKKKRFVENSAHLLFPIYMVLVVVFVAFVICGVFWLFFKDSIVPFIVFLSVTVIWLLYCFFGRCICVFIDGSYVIKRTVFKETVIDISEPKAFCEQSVFNNDIYIIVSFDRRKIILINKKTYQINDKDFFEKIKTIRAKYENE